MKSKRMCVTATALLAVLAMPVRFAAQSTQKHNNHKQQLRYKLIDLGTFGGPTSWFCNDLNLAGGACAIQNSRGTIVSGADTSESNPNYQNPSPFSRRSPFPGIPIFSTRSNGKAMRFRTSARYPVATIAGRKRSAPTG